MHNQRVETGILLNTIICYFIILFVIFLLYMFLHIFQIQNYSFIFLFYYIIIKYINTIGHQLIQVIFS